MKAYIHPFEKNSPDAVYVRLPKSLWKPAGICECNHCGGKESFWDTLCIPLNSSHKNYDEPHTVHWPELEQTGIGVTLQTLRENNSDE